MVAVEMREQQGRKAVSRDSGLVERDHAGAAAIEQQACPAGLDMQAGVEAPAGAEGVARAEDGDLHGAEAATPTPPPCGEGQGWGANDRVSARQAERPPSPYPSPQGGREEPSPGS